MRPSAARHLLSLITPAMAIAFVATGPHRGWVALAMLPAPLVPVGVEWLTRSFRDAAPAEEENGWPFDAMIVAHAAIHFALLAAYLRLAARQGLTAADFWVGVVLVGNSASLSAIVVGHELIHRRSPWLLGLGRALLATVFYEHFATEHVRGHHVRVGTDDDAATARFGETLVAFTRRTIPAQFRSAWRIECRRLGDENMKAWDARLLRSRVVHGLAMELGLLVATIVWLGPTAAAALLLVAFVAIQLLETVNYIEHWGLARNGRRVMAIDSWDTDSAFSRYAIVGLACHADHHAHPSRPFPTLRRVRESPKMPYGYPLMILLATARNGRFRRLMTDELRRRGLGPFGAGPPPAPAE